MTSLNFYYGTMNSGKSTLAIQLQYSRSVAGKQSEIFVYEGSNNSDIAYSRIGISCKANSVNENFSFKNYLIKKLQENKNIEYFICDETQFYSTNQINELSQIVDNYKIQIDCFGLLTDFSSKLFPASKRLVEISNNIIKIQNNSYCWCGKIATHNARIIKNKIVKDGESVMFGDIKNLAHTQRNKNETIDYVVLCRYHYDRNVWVEI